MTSRVATGEAPLDQILRQALAAQRRGGIADAKRLYQRVLKLDPTSETACTSLAIIAAQEGDLKGAETLFRRAIDLGPERPESINNLGRLLLQQGRIEEAIAAHRHAIEIKPDRAASHYNLGNALRQQGRLEEAAASYRRAIALKPDHAEAGNNLALVLRDQGRREEAILVLRQVIAHQPAYGEAHYNLGLALDEFGDFAAAAAAYRHVLKLRPDVPEAYNNLGGALRAQGLLEQALAAYEQAIRIRPDHAQTHYNRGIVLQQQGRPDAALAAYRQAIALQPNHVEAANNAGILLNEQGLLEEAAATFRQILAQHPTHAEAHNNLGAVLLEQGRLDEAGESLRQALALRPDYPEAHYNIGNGLREAGKLDDAIAAYRQALRLRPDYPEAFAHLVHHRWRACDWTDYEADQQRLLGLVRGGAARVPPFYLFAARASAADQLCCARKWIEGIAPDAFHHEPATRQGRIRLGYLSADFHRHATASLMAELFERHDRSRFEVTAYSYGDDDASPMRERLARAFERFVDIRPLPHHRAAARIREDGIDILIDLKGHTRQARPKILAARPAPIQVSYLGYPATMGATFIDYILADKFVAPYDQQPFFAEQLVHLPGCYQANDTRREIAATPSRADCGLPEPAFVFCCFNNSYKITPAFFDIWMRLLEAVPASVLWLMESNALVERNLRLEASRRGVDPARLVLAPIVPSAEHLARHRLADLFLDTLPCNAHTTASDALWAGLPVLTCAGETFAGRVAGSLLTAIGMPELITSSLDAYERLALELAGHPRRLTDLRDKLQRNRGTTALFDISAFTRRIEAAYARMWETWRAGEAPSAFAVE